MGTALVRTDPKGRNYQTLLHEDLFAPLGMDSTSMGLRPISRRATCKPDMRGTVPIQHLSRNLPGDHALFEDPEVEGPHVGCASTSGDLYRFAEMLRRGGELDGVRLLSPATLQLARQVHTGDMPNQLYKRVAENAGWDRPAGQPGIGFQVRGTGVFHHLFGTLASPRPTATTARAARCSGSIRRADVSFALCSAGVMTQARNIERCQKLTDLALSAHDLRKRMADADIIAIGSGHNGLVAAAYLAVAGKSVLVLERNEWFGGGVVTRELTRPGFRARPAFDEPHLHPGQSAAAERRVGPQAQVRPAVRVPRRADDERVGGRLHAAAAPRPRPRSAEAIRKFTRQGRRDLPRAVAPGGRVAADDPGRALFAADAGRRVRPR